MGSRSVSTPPGQIGGWTIVGALGRYCRCGTNDRIQLVRPELLNAIQELLQVSVLSFFTWCENSAVGEAIRASRWLFPAIESFHLLGLAVIGGSVLIVDLRLFGFGLRRQPVAQLALDAQRWLIGSLMVMLASGILLFTSEAIKCYYHIAFWVKMTSLLLAIVFTFTFRRKVTMDK